jgi:hypothetical protein
MILPSYQVKTYFIALAIGSSLLACTGDPSQTGVDPFAPMVFKESKTSLPLNPPNPKTLVPFYVSKSAVFKFAIDTDSILIGEDGVTRFTVVMTSPNGNQQTQYEGIRCDSWETRTYGKYDNGVWKENTMSAWRGIIEKTPNRYQAALAQGAFCNMNVQIKNIRTVVQSLNPEVFTGDTQNTNSNTVK